jgi:Domain of unknown function (DUF4276)
VWDGQTYSPSVAVEGMTDEAVAARVCRELGIPIGPVYGRRGKDHLREHIAAYNAAAAATPWLVLVDLDHGPAFPCAPSLVASWLAAPSANMCLSVAVHETEAWLLGDPDRFSSYFGVPPGLLPASPERVLDPKALVVQVCSQSRRRDVREDMVPRPGAGTKIGSGYASKVIQFASDPARGWRPQQARLSCPSLDRVMRRLTAWLAQ